MKFLIAVFSIFFLGQLHSAEIEVLPDGVTLKYNLLPTGQIESVISSDETIHHRYFFDAKGRLTSANSLNSSFVRTLSSNDQILEEEWSHGTWIKKIYENDKLTHLLLPSCSINFHYDDHHLAAFTLNGKTVSLEHLEKAKSFYPLEIGYNEHGLPESYKFHGHLTQFRYNERGALIGENGIPYCFPTNNLLFQPIEKDEMKSLFDVRGRLIAKQTPNALIRYHYNTLSELVAAETPSQKINFTYDPLGRRTVKQVQNKITQEISSEYYIYDGMWEIAALNDQGELLALRLFPDGNPLAPLAIEVNHLLYFPLSSPQGNTLGMLDEDFVLHPISSFNAFGEIRNLLPHPWAYTGHRFDAETQLYYFGKRYYDPQLLAWITPDPLGPIDSTNLYLYMMNNPIAYTDLQGEFAIAIPLGIGLVELGKIAITGIIAGYSAWKWSQPIEEFPTRVEKNDGTPKSNKAQNKQFEDAVKEIEKKLEHKLRDKDIRALHDEISGKDYSYWEIIEEGVGMFDKSYKLQ